MKRPWEVTFLGSAFILWGVVWAIIHAWHAPLDRWLALLELVQVWAIAGGVFLLQGKNWARWALLVWLALHIIVGALHSVQMAASHLILAAAIAYALLRPPASLYFQPTAKA